MREENRNKSALFFFMLVVAIHTFLKGMIDHLLRVLESGAIAGLVFGLFRFHQSRSRRRRTQKQNLCQKCPQEVSIISPNAPSFVLISPSEKKNLFGLS
jgi:hypothetical protein